jgi:hypothetical protein
VADPALDPQDFLDQLKADRQVLRWEPLPPEQARREAGKEQIRNRESLEYLHHHWALPDTFDPADAGGGFRGRLVSLFGRLTYRVLGRYLREERELISHLVRINEGLEQRCDELTVRCEHLKQDMLARQAAEASNQAKLALLLHLDSSLSAPGKTQENGTGTGPVTGG